MVRRFCVAFAIFAWVILTGAFLLAILAANAYSAPETTLSCRVNVAATASPQDLHTFAQVPWDR